MITIDIPSHNILSFLRIAASDLLMCLVMSSIMFLNADSTNSDFHFSYCPCANSNVKVILASYNKKIDEVDW